MTQKKINEKVADYIMENKPIAFMVNSSGEYFPMYSIPRRVCVNTWRPK